MCSALEGGFLTQIRKAMINTVLRTMYKYHFVSECFDIGSIMDDMDENFLKCFSPVHCLHSLLPPVKSNPHGLRSRDHNFQLPVCNNFSRKSFIIRSLFRFKYIFFVFYVFLIASFYFCARSSVYFTFSTIAMPLLLTHDLHVRSLRVVQ